MPRARRHAWAAARGPSIEGIVLRHAAGLSGVELDQESIWYLVDRLGIVVDTSDPRMARHVGGKTLMVILHPDDPASLDEAWDAVLGGSTTQVFPWSMDKKSRVSRRMVEIRPIHDPTLSDNPVLGAVVRVGVRQARHTERTQAPSLEAAASGA